MDTYPIDPSFLPHCAQRKAADNIVHPTWMAWWIANGMTNRRPEFQTILHDAFRDHPEQAQAIAAAFVTLAAGRTDTRTLNAIARRITRQVVQPC
jgi:hypothetical protein